MAAKKEKERKKEEIQETTGQEYVYVNTPTDEKRWERLVRGNGLAKVRLEYGMTINIGNYQSARVTVGVELPSEPEDEKLQETYEKAVKFVEEKIKVEVEAIRQRYHGEVEI